MPKLNVGIASFAHGHVNSYLEALMHNEDVHVVGGWDNNRERAEAGLKPYGLPYYADYRDLLAAGIDAVVICSENASHAELTILAAEAGKHVLCEKPLGVTLASMREMIRVCKERGVQLMTAFPCRYLPAVIEAKEAIDRGDIGRVIAVKGTNRGSMPGNWFVDPALSGGGAVLDHTVHVMDLLRWVLRTEPEEVYAESGTLFHPELEVEDAGMVHATFGGGVPVVLDTSWSRLPSFPTWGDVTLEFVGTDGTISVDSFAQVNQVYRNGANKAEWSAWGDSMDQYLVADFVSAVLNGTPVPISGEDGLASAAVALAAFESIASGAKVAVQR